MVLISIPEPKPLYATKNTNGLSLSNLWGLKKINEEYFDSFIINLVSLKTFGGFTNADGIRLFCEYGILAQLFDQYGFQNLLFPK